MPIDTSFLSKVAIRIAMPSRDAPSGIAGSILTVSAGSYGFRTSHEEATMPTGFDPQAAALFETIVEAAYLVATADGVFDEDEQQAFEHVVLEACRGSVRPDQLDALLADLADQLAEDGIEGRVNMVSRTVTRPDHQREVLRIAALLANVSGGVTEPERDVIAKLTASFGLSPDTVDVVMREARESLSEVTRA
jgi:tellurite resistance protein